MDQMVLDAKSALASHQKRTYQKPSSATSPSRRSLPSLEAALPTQIVSALENVSHLPLLMIEVQSLAHLLGDRDLILVTHRVSSLYVNWRRDLKNS